MAFTVHAFIIYKHFSNSCYHRRSIAIKSKQKTKKTKGEEANQRLCESKKIFHMMVSENCMIYGKQICLSLAMGPIRLYLASRCSIN